MAVGHFDYINSRHIPAANREYVESFDNLAGGINTLDQAFLLKSSESPMMKNLTYREGMLGSRRGQKLVVRTYKDENNHDVEVQFFLPTKTTPGNKDIEYLTCAQFLFHGWLFVQGDAPGETNPNLVYAVKMEKNGVSGENHVGTIVGPLSVFSTKRVGSPGVFLQYRELVLFKGAGAYQSFQWNSATDTISAFSLRPFIPVLDIDTDPTTGAGTFYQRINRLTDSVKVGYLAPANQYTYQLPVAPIKSGSVVWAWVGDPKNEDASDVSGSRLIDNTVDYTTGVVTLDTAQAEGASVVIQFEIDDSNHLNTIMDSPAAAVFGGAQDLCVVVGGPTGQPNSYFWSDSDGNTMNPMYFPEDHYNLAGDNDDPITCFGKQQNMLVVFQKNATGRVVFGTETINGLVVVTMNYTRINAEIGCDFPASLQLVENNLVWVSRKYGVCRLKDCSAAYENNITILSRKIHNGWYTKDENSVAEYTGLFSHLRNVSASNVYSVDTGTRYLFCVRGVTARWFYGWNYEISSYENPSWYIHTNIEGIGFLSLENDQLMEVTPDGVIAEFTEGAYYDEVKYNAGKTELVKEPIRKVYFFPPRSFGSYDRLKNIMSCIFTTRHDTDQSTRVYYNCDYEDREDPTRLTVTGGGEHWGRPFASVFRRKPGYHNIRHLQVRLLNNEVDKDLSIISLQIYYTYRGRQR